jgi:hypothetical protein
MGKLLKNTLQYKIHVVANANRVVHTYIPLTLDPRRGIRGVSDIPPRRPRITRMTAMRNTEIEYLLPPTLIPLSGVGTTCCSSCCDKDSAIIFTTGRLPDVNPP